ncbi:MAG: pyruvate ferredoxin oxidoreductase [Candidatus Kariarchaeaceae archaeon]
MVQKVGMTGDEAAAIAAAVVDPDVLAAYPITPQTIIVERFSDFVHDGKVRTKYVPVESEHSAMSSCVGASATGARVFTASSSQGIALMYEILPIASGNRLPIVMATVNRALSAPINIHAELSEQMMCRDLGWISWFGENAQEAYDQTILGFKVAEHKDVLLPMMYGISGFIVSHALEAVAPVEQKDVHDFIGANREMPDFSFHPETHGSQGLLALQDYYFEVKRQQVDAMENAVSVTKKAFQEFGEITGRYYDFIETYKMEDAESAIISMGSFAGTAKAAVDLMREKGEKVGALKVLSHRPWPGEQIKEAIKDLKYVTIIDRSQTYGSPATMLQGDVLSSLFGLSNPPTVHSFVAGLGGRDVLLKNYIEMHHKAAELHTGNKPATQEWFGVRL